MWVVLSHVDDPHGGVGDSSVHTVLQYLVVCEELAEASAVDIQCKGCGEWVPEK